MRCMPHATCYDIGKCHMAKGVGPVTVDVTWGEGGTQKAEAQKGRTSWSDCTILTVRSLGDLRVNPS